MSATWRCDNLVTGTDSLYFDIMERAKSVKSKRRRKRIAGITAASAALGVTRFHLYKVLTGNRESPKLLARYHKLKSAQPQKQNGN